MYSLRLGLESLRQHARRNMIAGAAIAVGLLATLSIIGFAERTNAYLAAIAMYVEKPGHVAIIKKDGLRRRLVEPKKYSLSSKEWNDLNRYLEKDPAVDFAAPYLFGFGLVGNGCKSQPFIVTGFDITKQKAVTEYPELKRIIPEFRSLTRGEALWSSSQKSPITLSGGLAKRLNKSAELPAKAFTEVIDLKECDSNELKAKLASDRNVQMLTQDFDNRLNAVDGEFVGEFSTGVEITEKSAMQMPLALLQDLLRTDKISYLGVFLKDRRQAHAYAKSIVRSMADRGVFIDAYTWDAELWNQNYFAGAAVLVVTELFVGVVVAIVVFLSIMNTLTIGLAEARREIGMLRAVGYNPTQISYIFTVEAFAMGIIAVIVGSILSMGLFHVISKLEIPMHFAGFSQDSTFQILPPFWSYFAASAFLLLLVAGTSMVLSRRYASQPILDLLNRGG